MDSASLWAVVMAVFVMNLPCGFWRAGARSLSLQWFLAIHAPVPAVIALRFLAGLGWRIETVPVLVAAYFGGQYLGGKLRAQWLGR